MLSWVSVIKKVNGGPKHVKAGDLKRDITDPVTRVIGWVSDTAGVNKPIIIKTMVQFHMLELIFS